MIAGVNVISNTSRTTLPFIYLQWGGGVLYCNTSFNCHYKSCKYLSWSGYAYIYCCFLLSRYVLSDIIGFMYYFSGCCSNNIIVHQAASPQLFVSLDAPPAVSSILLVDSMGKSFPQNYALMKVITMSGSNYYYTYGLIAGQLLDISRFPQVFMLLGSNLLKLWNNKHLLKEAVQDFIETVTAANPLAMIFIGSIIPQLGVKQQTLDHLKEFNWATQKKISKLSKRGFTVEYINVHKLFLNNDGSFKAITAGMLLIITTFQIMELI